MHMEFASKQLASSTQIMWCGLVFAARSRIVRQFQTSTLYLFVNRPFHLQLGFWTLSIVQYCKEHWRARFRNWIGSHLQVRGWERLLWWVSYKIGSWLDAIQTVTVTLVCIWHIYGLVSLHEEVTEFLQPPQYCKAFPPVYYGNGIR
jgi:hypothetical protein